MSTDKSFSFNALGITHNPGPGCFVCGDGNSLYERSLHRRQELIFNTLSADVLHQKEVPEILKLFGGKGVINSSLHPDDPYQVRVGACNFHRPSLVLLKEITRENNYAITLPIVASCLKAKPTEHLVIPEENQSEVIRLFSNVRGAAAGTDIYRRDRSISAAMKYGAAVHWLWEFLAEVTGANTANLEGTQDWELDIDHMVVLKGNK